MVKKNRRPDKETQYRFERVALGAVVLLSILFSAVMYSATSCNVEMRSSFSKEEASTVLKPEEASTVLQPASCDESFELAKKQSFGFFDDISADNWSKLRDLVANHKEHFNMDNPSAYWSVRGVIKPDEKEKLPAEWFQSHYEPNFSCMFKIRVGGNGGNGDGPKWVRGFRGSR